MPKREYPAANYCIYRSERSVCGGELGDEHVIAYGLGGDLILPAASCQKHEAVTSLIERRALKGNFDSLRVWLGLRSRRPKERPTTITYTAQSSDRTIQQELPPAQHPFCIALWVYKKPELLLGNRSGNSGAAWIQMLGDPNLFPKDTEVTVPGAVDSNVTGQLLAKVAHAYAVAELGQSFRPLLLDLLNERDDKILTNALVNQLVGGTEEKEPPPSTHLHELALETRTIQGRDLIVVTIRLFACIGPPVYQVIAGDSPSCAVSPRSVFIDKPAA